MFSRKTQKRISLLCTFLILAVCILAFGNVTSAWFTKNRHLESQNQKIQIDNVGVLVEDYKVYRYDWSSNSVSDVTNTPNEYVLPQYDSIFKEKNERSPLLYEIHLSNVDPSVQTLMVTVECASTSTSPTSRLTSNIVYFKAAARRSVSIAQGVELTDSTAAGTKQSTAVSYFSGSGQTAHCFSSVTKSGNTYTFGTKQTSINFNVTIPAGAVELDTDTGDYKLVLYMLIGYDELLVEAQDITYFGDIDIQSLSQEIQFDNDITRITFSYVN